MHIFEMCLSLFIRSLFDRCHEHHQGNLQELWESKNIVKMYK